MTARISKNAIEVATIQPPNCRVSKYSLEVAASSSQNCRVSKCSIEVAAFSSANYNPSPCPPRCPDGKGLCCSIFENEVLVEIKRVRSLFVSKAYIPAITVCMQDLKKAQFKNRL